MCLQKPALLGTITPYPRLNLPSRMARKVCLCSVHVEVFGKSIIAHPSWVCGVNSRILNARTKPHGRPSHYWIESQTCPWLPSHKTNHFLGDMRRIICTLYANQAHQPRACCLQTILENALLLAPTLLCQKTGWNCSLAGVISKKASTIKPIFIDNSETQCKHRGSH